MTDTIELLEAIGRDASLRHASPYDLEQALAEMGASEGLKMAAASSDSDPLKQEFGSRLNGATQVNQNPNDGGCDIVEDDDFNEDQLDRDDGSEAGEVKPGV